MIKKILIGLIGLNLVLAGWFLKDEVRKILNVSKTQEITKEEITDSSDTIEKNNQLKENIIAEGEIKMAYQTEDGRIIYYNKNNFLETDSEGRYKKNISSYPFKEVKTVKCSKSGKFCLVWADGFYVYNLTTKEIQELDKNIKGIDFNSQEDGLVYLFQEDSNYQLSFSGLLGENWIKLLDIKGENLGIAVSSDNNRFVYFSREVDQKASGIFLGELIGNKNIEKIIDKDIIDVKWSPSGDKILFSFYDHSVSPKRVQLGLYDLNQKKEFVLGIPTIAQKCAWEEDSSFLCCAALATSEPQEFVLDDWYSGGFISQDVFWKIDLFNSKKERIFFDKNKYTEVDSFDLFISNNSLFFVDKITGNLIKREK